MKTIISPDLWPTLLGDWRGSQALVWMFHVSHSRFALRLSRSGTPEVVYVLASGCERIVGPFGWKPASISIVYDPAQKSNRGGCRICDGQAGFELVCSSAFVVKGPATEIDSNFESFFGDADDERECK